MFIGNRILYNINVQLLQIKRDIIKYLKKIYWSLNIFLFFLIFTINSHIISILIYQRRIFLGNKSVHSVGITKSYS